MSPLLVNTSWTQIYIVDPGQEPCGLRPIVLQQPFVIGRWYLIKLSVFTESLFEDQ